MININQAARAVLLDQLTRIANSGNVEALQALLSGAGLPALSRDAEPAEQIRDALESGDHYASLARRIAHLLAKLVLHRAESLEQRLAALEGAGMGGSSAQVYEPTYLQDENYVFNLFLLAARLPREQELFSGLQHFHDIGFKREVILASINNRVGFQLRRALAEQQHDKSLRAYWLDLLQEKNRQWNPARRTELLEAWHGLLGTFDFTADKQDALDTLDQGLCALHGSVEHHPQAIDLLELAVWRLENAYPLDPLTWINYLAPYWNEWPELLQDVAARTWPGLEPKAHEDMPPLLGDLNALWVAMSEDQQSEMNDFLRRNAAEGGRKFLQNLIFRPPVIADKSPQEVRTLLTKLGEHLWPTEKKAARNIQQHEPEDWEKEKPARGARRASFDRLARLNSVNQTLVEIESRLAAGDEVNARRFLDELLEQQRNSPLHDRHLHTAKTLAKAGAIVQRFGYLEWAESLLREACQENHNDKVSACGLADVLKARGELDAAEQQYRLNVARWPNNEVSACGLADVLKARGELDAAEQQYRLNVARWPNDEVSACGLADVLKARGELDAAESQYRNNVTRWPNNEVSANGLADVLKARGELDAAESQYRNNVTRWPNNEVSANGLADVLKARGELDAAEQQYRLNVARWPNNEVSACGLADVLKARGELDAAESQYRNNVTRWPNNEVSANGLADVLKARGELDAAEQQYRLNVARWPNNEVSACGLADVLKARGELDAAEQQYRLNVARWPNDEVSACGLADVLKARGELDAAEQQYRLNVARWPNDEVSACGLADVLKARGELDAAESEYRNNVTRWPNNRVAKHGLANVLRKMKRHAEALTLLPESKGDGYDLHLRAMILLDLGRIEDARNSLNQGLQAAIGSKETALFHRGLALLALRSNDLPRASEILATLPDNVIPLDLMRLHLQAAEDHGTAAGKLVGALDARHTKMYSGEKRVFDLLRSGFDLHAEKIGRQPQQAELDEIFEAEIDLLLAA